MSGRNPFHHALFDGMWRQSEAVQHHRGNLAKCDSNNGLSESRRRIPRQHPGFPGASWEFSLRRHNHCTGEFELDGKRSICSTLNFSDHAGNGHLHSGAGKPGDDQRGFRRWPDAYRPGNAELFLIDGLECRPLMGLVISPNSPSSPLRSSE